MLFQKSYHKAALGLPPKQQLLPMDTTVPSSFWDTFLWCGEKGFALTGHIPTSQVLLIPMVAFPDDVMEMDPHPISNPVPPAWHRHTCDEPTQLVRRSPEHGLGDFSFGDDLQSQSHTSLRPRRSGFMAPAAWREGQHAGSISLETRPKGLLPPQSDFQQPDGLGQPARHGDLRTP